MNALYLHGFASGPDSWKGRRIGGHLEARGWTVQRLDLRRPSMERLRVSEMVAHVHERAEATPGPLLVLGSSLGGLVAARVAAVHPRVAALVLLAPAFGLAARWRSRQPGIVAEWERTGWLEVDDHARGGKSRVDWGFFADAEQADAWPDVRVPTLVVHGTRDDVVGIESSRAWADRPGATLVEVDDGHELQASITTTLTELDAFLARSWR